MPPMARRRGFPSRQGGTLLRVDLYTSLCKALPQPLRCEVQGDQSVTHTGCTLTLPAAVKRWAHLPLQRVLWHTPLASGEAQPA